MPMPPFVCACQKSFTTQHKLNAHRANSVRCKQQWNAYVSNFPSILSALPGQPALAEDVLMEDVANDNPEDGDSSMLAIDPVEAIKVASNNDLSSDESESDGPVEIAAGEDDVSSLDETYRFPSFDNSDQDDLSDSDGEFEHVEDLDTMGMETPHTSPQRTGPHEEPLEQPIEPLIEVHPHAGFVKERGSKGPNTSAHTHRNPGAGNAYYPFANEMDFELGAWLHESGLSMTKINEFLKLKYVRDRMPSFTSGVMLHERIELLADGGPQWKQQQVMPEYGNPIGPVTLYYRNVMEAVAHLLSNPSLAPHLEFRPKRVWSDASKKLRIYSEMFHGEWWWDIQDTLVDGATVVPVMIGSDKTHLTDFSGDKKAWPVYLSIGNISMKARRTPSLNTWIIIGYMPVVAWNNPDDITGTLSNRLFHQCAKIIFQPLIQPGTSGTLLMDSLGRERLCFPRLAAWLADYQEQVLLNCVAWGTCPVTLAGGGSLGSVDPSPPRTTAWILRQIKHILNEVDPGDIKKYQVAAKERMLNGVHTPFWENLPGYQAHLCVAPDLLHGVIRFARDHMLKWTRRLVGLSEFDRRLKDLKTNPGFRHFKKGISHLSQMTGREDRELQRVTVALIAGAPKVSPKAMRCIRAFHDFLYLTQYRSHDQETIGYLSDALKIFHATKNVFIETGVRKGKGRTVLDHFEIPKIAAFHSYEWHIPQLGTSTQFSTEIIETLHKPMAKQPYKSTNRRDYAVQMCRYLDRRERVAHARGVHAWRTLQEQAENMTMALSGLSPRHRLLVKDQFFKPKEQPISRLQKSRKNTTLWLNLRPTHRETTLAHLATTYQLPTLMADVDRYLTTMGDGSEVIARRGVAEVLYVDAWEKLRIHVSDVQDDNEFSHIHTVEALPPGAQGGRYPYGHGHCILVHHTAAAQAVGIEGKPKMYSISICS